MMSLQKVIFFFGKHCQVTYQQTQNDTRSRNLLIVLVLLALGKNLFRNFISMTSLSLVESAFLHALLSINCKWLSGCLLSIQSRFSTSNISHVQCLFKQYANHRVLKYFSIIT